MRVDTLRDCVAALKDTVEWGSPSPSYNLAPTADATAPGGCYTRTEGFSTTFVFNENSLGVASPKATPVCKSTTLAPSLVPSTQPTARPTTVKPTASPTASPIAVRPTCSKYDPEGTCALCGTDAISKAKGCTANMCYNSALQASKAATGAPNATLARAWCSRRSAEGCGCQWVPTPAPWAPYEQTISDKGNYGYCCYTSCTGTGNQGAQCCACAETAAPSRTPTAGPKSSVDEPGSNGLVNMECSKWRDNKNGWANAVGSKFDMSITNQMRQMAYCMEQDCIQSLETHTSCRYTDANRFCYLEAGQVFCEKKAPYPSCNDLGARMYMPNVAGAGAWAPLVNVTVFGSAAKTNAPYSCFCLKNCVNSASLTENSFVCTGGKPAAQVGAVAGSPLEKSPTFSSIANKDGMCGCMCGYPGTNMWQKANPQ